MREVLLKANISIGDIKSYDNYDHLLCDGEDPRFQLKRKYQYFAYK